MAYYKSKEDMFLKRAERASKIASSEWGKAKSGEGGFHFARARKNYGIASDASAKAIKYKGRGW